MADDLLTATLERASGRLAAYGYLLTGSQHASEDLVQDALVKVFVKRRRIPNAAAAEGYVRAAMRTLHVDRLRRERLWRREAPGQVVREEAPDHAEAIATSDAVARALDALAPRERTAVVLRYFDDLTLADVAGAMGLATGTVKRYLSDALDRLAVEVGHDAFETERVAVVETEERS
ncbi:sigma-70 family RNA polymerase sigma factor [Demequina sp. NBRC 110053]|uniref:sigma-70 family RNA polymerase sigma factor n=1 Tax=Demequina sp. NBRC 110053 TaxID=1570342 RepID=UPI0013564391|nr:sigma-70 family RNA polymerase sigma factor [Demequina sp. NBRC 110053]